MSASPVLVTGGSGFVGTWAVAALLRRGEVVRATVRDPAKADEVSRAVRESAGSSGSLEVVRADLSADDGWDEAMAGVDRVLHIASPLGTAEGDAEAVIGPAVDGTRRVLEAATRAGVRRVVVTSAANAASPSSYAEESVTDENLWTDPDDPTLIPYRRAKTLAERVAWRLADEPGAPELATVLPGAVFGPILSTATVGSVRIIARMLRGEMPFVPNIGLEVVDVRDVVDLHLRALDAPEAAGERFLATGDFAWMRDIAQVLVDELGDSAAKVSTERIDDDVIRALAEHDAGLAGIVPGLGRRNRHSTAKARDMLGWQPRSMPDVVVDCAHSLIAHGVV